MAQHVHTTIRYDGAALRDHEMDVEDLAPALLALAEIAQIANRKFNGDRASLKVLVNADIEQRCFQLDLSLIQSLLDQAQTFIGKDNVTTAAELAQIIGLTGGATGTLFGLYKWLFGQRKAQAGISFTRTEATGVTIVNIVGDGNAVEVANEVAALASDPEITKRVKTVLRPLQRQGYEDFTILERDKPVIRINKSEAGHILSAETPMLMPPEDAEEADPIFATGPAWVDTPHFRGQAKWTLIWSGQRVDAKMPDEFLQRFQDNEVIVVPNARLNVRMKVLTAIDENGQPTGSTEFIVEEVLNVELPPKAAKQLEIFEKPEQEG